jgi:hypothetical protein
MRQIPDVPQPNHYHSYGHVQHAPARVMLFIRHDKERQKERMQTCEHPFGTIKRYDGAGYFLYKGKEKVAAETALMYLSCNIRRAIALAVGAQSLKRCSAAEYTRDFYANMTGKASIDAKITRYTAR